MKYRQLGDSALYVSPLAFGSNVLGWTLKEPQAYAVLDALVASGCNFIDTADIYCRWASGHGGESETILGNWMRLRKNRKDIVLATKVGMDMGKGKTGLSKKYILHAVNDSLKRLQTDYIDLYQSHKDDERTPVEETLSAFEQLIKEGKVRYIGASNFSGERLLASLEASAKHNLPRYQSLQPHYNLCERKSFETELEQICLARQVSVINYFPLASGFLTGKYRATADLGQSPRGENMHRFMNAKGFGILATLDDVASKHGCRPAAAALAWYMARPAICAPIASATSVTQLRELTEALTVKLDKEDIAAIDSCSGY